MSLGLESFSNASKFLSDTAFQGATFAGECLSKGAHLAGNGASWVGRQVVALTPVVRETAAAFADQIVKVATLVAAFASKGFSVVKTAAQTGYQVSSQFVTNHPRDVVIGLGAVALTVTIGLIAQKLSSSPKKDPAAV